MGKFLMLALFALYTFSSTAIAQKNPFHKFGKVTKDHLAKSVYEIDTAANAVVLSHVGESSILFDSRDGFSLQTSVHKVTHILNDRGYDEATVEINLFSSGTGDEAVKGFKAVTYNLENGKVVETKLAWSAVIREKSAKNWSKFKFTMPNVKKGSIIEYYYDVKSSFISFPDPWYFQSTFAPTLWSEYNFLVPDFFNYQFSSRGYLAFNINEKNVIPNNFTSKEFYTYFPDLIDNKIGETHHRWVVLNAPELKTEPYTKSVRNHLARIDVQLAAQQYPLQPKNLSSSWRTISSDLLESDYFGKNLTTSNGWLKDEVRAVIAGEKDPLLRAKKIFRYVQQNMKCTGNSGIYLTESLRTVFKEKKGSVSEVNLLLTAMLHFIDLEAQPVLLSTAQHGYALEFLPMLQNMNYVVCKVSVEGMDYVLDASNPMLGFGRLPLYCYNGFSLPVTSNYGVINLSSNSISESPFTIIAFANSEQGYTGQVGKTEGYYSSLDIRETIQSKGEDEYIQSVQKKYGENYQTADFKIDRKNEFDNPIALSYKLKMETENADVLYINPYFGEYYKKNPFISATRAYPVEFPYVINETVMTSLEVPAGYSIDEAPKSILLYLDNSKQSFFEYKITRAEHKIELSSKLRIAKTLVTPEEYPALREFFNLVVKKQSEQIVFKKDVK